MNLVLTDQPAPQLTVVTLNNPDRLNALSMEMVSQLYATFEALAESDTRVVILTGAGRGFCSGLDLSQPAIAPTAKAKTGPAAGMRTQEFVAGLVPKVMALPQPVIAAVNGAAVGGGLGLAAACDLRIAARSALFCTQFIKLGLSGCDIGVSYTLPKLLGATRAADLIFTARRVGAEEAERIGLVSEIVDDEKLLTSARKIADILLSYSPFGLEMTKQVFRANLDAANVEAAIALENRTQILAATQMFAASGQTFSDAVEPKAKDER
ncbi:MAG: enoyl-CoA hydratase/isomerase family protein [Ilumatobacteraceae bacterium]